MAGAHSRKKEPAAVRRRLIDCAARIAIAEGIAGVTVQAVADAANVTKGGLFHHFSSKQALVEAMFSDLVARMDAEIDAAIENDPEPRGAFTRAYVDAVFVGEAFGLQSPWAALCVSIVVEPRLRRLWNGWLEARLARHAATDGAPAHEIVRLAADGAWLSVVMGEDGGAAESLAGLRARLIGMTHAAWARLTARENAWRA